MDSVGLDNKGSSKGTIGVFLAKFNPLTIYHENSIESALASGVFDMIAVVPSDITAELFRTPVLDRSNMINTRYHEDPRILSFLPHKLNVHGQPWIHTILSRIRAAGNSPVGVFLWEDYSVLKKRKRLLNMVELNYFITQKQVGGDEYLILYGEDEEGIDAIPDKDPDTGKKITTFKYEKPPGSGEVRTYLSNNPQLYENGKMFKVGEDILPLSESVRHYVYRHRLFIQPRVTGNITDAFRNTFGTGLGKLLGRVPPTDEEIDTNVQEKLKTLGII